jgi:hypothetical protein
MKIERKIVRRTYPWPARPLIMRCASSLLAVALSIAMFLVSIPSSAADEYVPGVAIVPEVRTPTGELRTYRTGLGFSYWRTDLPIYKGDKVLLNVFVCLGGAELAETRVRIDNEEIGRRTSAPWSVQLDTGNLKEGYHFAEAWAKTKGDRPHTATATVTIFIDPHAPGASPQAPLVEPLQSTPDPVVLTLPPSQGGPSVTLSCDDPNGQKSLSAGSAVRVVGPVVFSVSGPAPAEGFVYALYRAGRQIHKSDVLPVGTRIKLRRDAPGSPGLLPGNLTLVVWGTDKEGRNGPSRKVQLDVPSANGAPNESVPFEASAPTEPVGASGELKEGNL